MIFFFLFILYEKKIAKSVILLKLASCFFLKVMNNIKIITFNQKTLGKSTLELYIYLSEDIFMENQKTQAAPFKMRYGLIFLIGFAFFGISLLWQVYDSWCPTFLTELFMKAMNTTDSQEVQYLVGVIMALDNLAALILLPIFGHLSDKTHTKLGKRMPYILVGTFVCAIAFPFIPVFFHYNNMAGMIALMLIVVVFAMMYRNPAVSLMPDLTPKPLRSRANGIINIMGYIGGFFATLVGMIFVLSSYLGRKGQDNWAYNNIWAIEIPFLVASVLMLISAVVLVCTIHENKLEEEMKEEMKRGEEQAEIVDKIKDDDAPLTKTNRIMLFLILGAEFFWFMADNGIGTYMTNYTLYHLYAPTSATSLNVIIGGVGSMIGFVLGGLIASKIGRKYTVISGLSLTALSFLTWIILSFTYIPGVIESNLAILENNATLPDTVAKASTVFPWPIYAVWFIKGLGMSLVHINSFPMVVELCSSKKIGAYTGYYYASSMAAQTITPMLIGFLLMNPKIFNYTYLPVYAGVCIAISLIVFFFLPNVKTRKTKISKGLEAIGQDDE